MQSLKQYVVSLGLNPNNNCEKAVDKDQGRGDFEDGRESPPNQNTVRAFRRDQEKSEIEKLIPTINALHEIFKTIGSDGIKLPQIAVVGEQVSFM